MNDRASSSGDPVYGSHAATGNASRVVRGGMWSLLGRTAIMAVSFITTPFLIRQLGTELYGAWALIHLCLGYMVFSDLGMGIASAKFAAAAVARRDDRDEVAAIWTSMLTAAGSASLAAIVLVMGAGLLVRDVFRLPLALTRDATLALQIVSISLLTTAIASVVKTSQLARFRFDYNAWITAGTACVQCILILLVLWTGGGLIELSVAILAVSVGSAVTHSVVSVRLQPLLIRPSVERRLAKPLLGFGLPVVVSAVVGSVIFHGEKILLVRLVSITALAYYAVAFAVAQLLDIAAAALIAPLLTAFSGLAARRDQAALQQLYNRMLKAILLCTPPAVVMLCVAGQPFIRVWAGEDFARHAGIPLAILVLGFAFNSLAHIPRTLLSALNRTDLIARYHLLQLLPYIVGATVLISLAGIMGAAAAWALRATAECLLMFHGARRLSGMRASPLGTSRWPYVWATAGLVVLSTGALYLDRLPGGRFLLSSTAVIVYAILMHRFVLSSEERDWLASSKTKVVRNLARMTATNLSV